MTLIVQSLELGQGHVGDAQMPDLLLHYIAFEDAVCLECLLMRAQW